MNRRERVVLVDRVTGVLGFAGILVTPANPCPMCGKPDWCVIDQDRGKVICARDPSGKAIGDAGWLFQYGPDMTPINPSRRSDLVMQAPPSIDAAGLARRYQEGMDEDALWVLARQLGVSIPALKALNVGYHDFAYTFPMCNQKREVIGIRLRSKDGYKWAVTGSRNGLFIPTEMAPGKNLLVVEGPTDTAAMWDLGYEVIGRPSCSACLHMTVEYCRRRDVVILANNDEAKHRPDESVFYPGQEGAERLANAMLTAAHSVKVILPLEGKDGRQWKNEYGATRGAIDAVIRNAHYWQEHSSIIKPTNEPPPSPDEPKEPEW